jgi:hypothetical protein
MGERTWRELDLRAGGRVPEREGCIWTPVYDYLTPGKTYRLEVEAVTAPAPAPIPPAPAAPAVPPAPVVAAAAPAPGPPPVAAAPAPPAPALVNQTWQPEGTKTCTADGATALDRTVLLPAAPGGALIAKIGGSSADTTVDKLPLFAVGRHCVFTVEAGKAGTLYLGVNDAVGSMARLTGHLTVRLWEAL